MSNVTMTSDKYPYNMDAWCLEKSRNVVNDLTNIIELLRNNEQSIPKDLYENINDYLHDAIIDATKIYGFTSGVKLESGEGNLIFDEGKEGLEKILVQFGMLDKTDKQKKIENLQELIIKLEESLNGDKSNRTLVHETLYRYQNRLNSVKKPIEQLEDLIEEVTFAKLEWEEFILTAKDIICDLKIELDKIKE